MNPKFSQLVKKYRPYPPMDFPARTWPGKSVSKAPAWCSVDLRDGNQALIQPMSLEKKLEMYQLLVDIGFREIEVGFPSASQVEYDFTRHLIDNNLIPDGVTIQVLTQAREHLIVKTYESIVGAKEVIVHLYNSTSTLQRRTVFKMDRKEITDLAVAGARLLKREEAKYPGIHFRYEYSPESFTGTEMDFAVSICQAVMEALQPTPDNRLILNLPATVELTSPNIYADQIEYFASHMKNRELAIISLHAHNDRGCAVAATELALMAGGERVEGTLFGNGERTGNVDLVTLALNMFSQGVDPQLDLSNINHLVEVYERVCKLPIHPRHPYAGELVYTAFSGSHQDAINKGMTAYELAESGLWEVPYLPIDPSDVGRTYESIIRINSQSGKGGVAYVLDKDYGYKMPKAMHTEFGEIIQKITEKEGRELAKNEIWQAFERTYLLTGKPYALKSFNVLKRRLDGGATQTEIEAEVLTGKQIHTVRAAGNGPLDAFCAAFKTAYPSAFTLVNYHEHAVGGGSSARAAAYIEIDLAGHKIWGVGIDTDIIVASVRAVLSALNRAA
ncbi:MAG: 2-isopropylmalate synthase [Desulfobulbaceae bacterium]|jgi:2-isopropylmalate synthase|nr:2-isopropylmalate synthase [Desulfobulbaceae bacterium]